MKKLKISHLFHWLYCFLMFLPVLAILPSIFYFAFNEHASDYTSQEVQINYKYETNEVNSVDDLISGNIYAFNFLNDSCVSDILDGGEFGSHLYIKLFYMSNTSFLDYSEVTTDEWYDSFNGGDISTNLEFFLDSDFTTSFYFYCGESYFLDYVFFGDLFFEHDTIVYGVLDDFEYLNSEFISNISSCPQEFIPIESVNVIENDNNISNVVLNSFNSVFDKPLFSWVKTSFIAEPFAYLAGMFGVTEPNSIIFVMTYWASMSIIWLCFDILLYLPNLVHRWLDKGALE